MTIIRKSDSQPERERRQTLGRESGERYPTAVVDGGRGNGERDGYGNGGIPELQFTEPAARQKAEERATHGEAAVTGDAPNAEDARSVSPQNAPNAHPSSAGNSAVTAGEDQPASLAATPADPTASSVPPRDAYRDSLTHVDEKGDVRMVDVSQKAVTQRIAIAEGTILMHPETQTMVLEDRAKKGDVLACARVAGIMASKRTSELIPMCHPLNITKSKVEIAPIPANAITAPEGWAQAREDGRVGFHVQVTCGVTGVTGIEMEALTAASVACLTIYDMCKAVDRGMEIVDVRLLHKEGGRSGVWERDGYERADATADELAGNPLASRPAAQDISPLPGGPGTGKPAPAIAFIGYQNSGKTTLVEKVISRLSQRGLRVGSIKHHGHKGFDIDQKGKDSWRHAQAGSRHVGLISPDQYAEYADTDREVPVADLLKHYTDVDVVIVEGYKTAGLPNIAVARSGVDRMRGRDSFDLVDENTIAVACNEQVARDFRAKAAAKAQRLAEEAVSNGNGPAAATNAGESTVPSLPPFLDINDAAAIVNFIMNRLGK